MRGVSPLVSLVLTIFLSFLAIFIALEVFLPFTQKLQDMANLNKGINSLSYLYNTIIEIAREAEGSQRISNFYSPFPIIVENNSLYFDFWPSSNLSLEGLRGVVRLEKSPFFLEYFNSYEIDSNASPSWNCYDNCKVEYRYILNDSISFKSFFNLTNFYVEIKGNGTSYFLTFNPLHLKSYFPFEDGLKDYSYFKNDGLLNGSLEFEKGVSGNAAKFMGNGCVRVNNSQSINITSNYFSISFWVKIRENKEQVIVDKLNESEGGYLVWITPENRIAYKIITNESTYVNSSNTVLDNNWHWIAISYNGSFITIYVDGSQDKYQAASGYIKPTTQDMFIGCNSSFSNYLNSSLDELQISNSSIEFPFESLILSKEKIIGSGRTNFLAHTFKNFYLVLASRGLSEFYEVKIKGNYAYIRGIIPLWDVVMEKRLRIPKGNTLLKISNRGMADGKSLVSIEIV